MRTLVIQDSEESTFVYEIVVKPQLEHRKDNNMYELQ